MNENVRVESALTSKYWCFTYLEQGQCPESVESGLIRELPHIDPRSWKERSLFGGIYVNGRSAELDRTLEAPCRLEYYEPKFEISKAKEHFPGIAHCHIVYEDEDLAVIFKPAGLPCLPTKEQGQFHLKGYFENYFSLSLHLPSRLDTSTSGLVALSKSARMNGKLQQAFEKRKVHKKYLLLTHGAVPWNEKQVFDAIGRDPRHAVLRKIDNESGRAAETLFRKLATREESDTLLAAYPKSGRTHQIRVHAASLGLPIVGDNFYHGREAAELHLLSFEVSLYHPFLETEVTVSLPEHLIPAWARCQEALCPSPRQGP